ncbi:MAG TPA: hypothetical protein VF275_07960 [Gammaproteobacteria bacterium]
MQRVAERRESLAVRFQALQCSIDLTVDHCHPCSRCHVRTAKQNTDQIEFVGGGVVRFLLPIIVLILIPGCASTHRIEPLVDIGEHRPITVVVKASHEPLQPTLVNSSGAAAALGMQYGFVGGFVGGIIDHVVHKTRVGNAEEAIKVLSDRLTAERINQNLMTALRTAQDKDSNPYFDKTALVHSRVIPPSPHAIPPAKPRPRPREFPDDEKLMAAHGTTLILAPRVAMSPSFESLGVRALVTGYLSESGRRVYQTELRCEVRIRRALDAKYNVAIWNHDEGSLLNSSFERCVKRMSQLLAVDMFEVREFDADSVAARKAARSGVEPIPRGKFKDFDIYEIQGNGFLLLDVIEEHVTLTKLGERWVVLEDSSIIQRVKSKDFDDIDKVARDILVHERYSEPVLDAVATRIWRLRRSQEDIDADIVDVLLEVIEESGNSRYRSFLTQVSEDARHWKIRNIAIATFDDLEPSDVEQFQPEARPAAVGSR